MKLLEIREGVCISIDKIECIERLNQLQSLIYMNNGISYEANFPYEVICNLIETNSNELDKNIETIANSSTFFAG